MLSYRTGLDSLMTGLTANARLSWTHYLKGTTRPIPEADEDPFAGEIGTAKNKANGTLAFNTRQWGVSFTGNYIGKSYEDDQFCFAFPEPTSTPNASASRRSST